MTLTELLPLVAELAARPDRRRSLAGLAADAGVSESTFQRAFSGLIKESPKQFNLRLQLETAALRLIGRRDSVLDVALSVGFDSHEGFSRAFRRRFGCSPCQFRRANAHLAGSAEHARLRARIAPCVNLFRVSSVARDRNSLMTYDISIRTVPELAFLYRQARCAHADLAQALGELLPAVFGFATEAGIEFRSPPMALYAEWGPGMVTVQAGLGVAESAASQVQKACSAGDGEFRLRVLPAGPAAVTVHRGPYDGLGKAHAAVEQYLAAHQRQPAGPPRETYLTDPGEVPDPADWQTQVLWPVAG